MLKSGSVRSTSRYRLMVNSLATRNSAAFTVSSSTSGAISFDGDYDYGQCKVALHGRLSAC
jgi:hypothetical protein